MISQALLDEKERIKEGINLVDFIERDGVALKKSGQWHVGYCPFHANNNTQAFGVTVDGWKCFAGCGSGDVFSYIMKRENCDFKTAKEKLANGVALTAMPVSRPKPSISARVKPQRIFSPISPKPTNLGQWQAYNPLLESYLINGYGLSVGVLPHAACDHERLLVPLAVNGVTLAIRGRSLGCDHVKWLQGAGGAHVLFNGAVILNKFLGQYDNELSQVKSRLLLGDTIFTGYGAIETVIVVENLVDSLLLQAKVRGGVGVVGAGGINPNGAIWRNLSLACKLAGVRRVVIAFDRPNERNEKETNNAYNNVVKGLQGVDVVRFTWPNGGYKDFGEWFKMTAPCDHKAHYYFIGDEIYCKKCQLHFPLWEIDQQVELLRENSPYWKVTQ